MAGNGYWITLLASIFAAGLTVGLLRAMATRRIREQISAAQAAASAAVREAEFAASSTRQAAETAVREEILQLRAAADEEQSRADEDMVRRHERLVDGEGRLQRELRVLEQRSGDVEERQRQVREARTRAKAVEAEVEKVREQTRQALELRAGETNEAVATTLKRRWLERARAEAAQRVRAIDTDAPDPKYERDARRVMEIAVSRYQNHFLTERNISTIRVGDEVCEILAANAGQVHQALQSIANVQLSVASDSAAVRLEGLDGVGREVARRALGRLSKKKAIRAEAKADPVAWATQIRTNLEREITALGKRAFAVLKVPRAHADIVQLVGALNYRTSHTQNQWLHAVEASFLAGMMASELGLDLKLARRATLMHDIGKALTHQIDGSHAVIGADIARTLGEDEIVANAIGAHHGDEPSKSLYAYLVAAADAMSGARPGARRETSELFTHRVEDLERIGTGYEGVSRAHAVHGGRELRVYVDEWQVGDVDAVELSSEIAEQIAEELTFPGQIKVTVIRAFEAVATAN